MHVVTHHASALVHGIVDTARLGSGTADATTFLRGDQTYAVPVAGSSFDPVANSVFMGAPRSHIHPFRDLFGLPASSLVGASTAGFATAITLDSTLAISAGALGISGLVALAKGGTAADLSGTGGANQFVKQSSAGAALTVGAITVADLPVSDVSSILAAQVFAPVPRDHIHSALDLVWGTLPAARLPALTGDITTTIGTVATTLANTAVTPGSYTNSSLTVDSKGRLTAASSGTAPVTTVTGTAPIASSGGTTPAISLNDTAVTPGSYTNTSLTVDAKGRLTAASSGAAAAFDPIANAVFAAPPRFPWMGLYPHINFIGGGYIKPSTSLLEVVAPTIYIGDTTPGAWDVGDGSTTASATVNVIRPLGDQKLWFGTPALGVMRIYNSEYYLRSSDAADGFYTKIINGNLAADNTLTLSVTATSTLLIAAGLEVNAASKINQDLQTTSATAAFAKLTVDNLTLDGNTLASTSGHIQLTPVAGSSLYGFCDFTQLGLGSTPSVLSFDCTGGATINTSNNSNLDLYPNGTGRTRCASGGMTPICVGGTIYTSATQVAVSTTAAGETTLATFTLPSSALSVNAQSVVVECAGTMAASATTTKTIKFKFGAKVFTVYAAILNTAQDWRIRARVMRSGAATQKCSVEFESYGSVLTRTFDYDTAAETLSSTVVVAVTGQLTTADLTNGIVGEMTVAEFAERTA